MKNILTTLLVISISLVSAQSNTGEYKVKNLSVNTKYSDFGVTYMNDSTVIFSSPRKRNIIKNIWKPNQQPYLDLYTGIIDNEGEIVSKQKFSPTVNSRFHEAVVVFTKDRKTAYFTRNNILDSQVKNDSTGTLKLQLFKTSIDSDGKWSKIERLPFNSDHFSTGHPALNEDETKLYFVSDRPGAIGETDIYYVSINTDGTYGDPVNLGENVNTTQKEMFPFVSKDILYFSSNGHDSKGGLDVFAVKKYTTTYSKPINLDQPINTEKDDFAYVMKKSRTSGFLSSNRDGGIGDDDIYAFQIDTPVEIECKQQLEGIVGNTDSNDEPLEGVKVSLLDDNKNEIKSIITGSNGVYRFEVECGKSYSVRVSKENFISDISPLNTKYDVIEEPNKISFTLKEDIAQVIASLSIDPIYYAYDKWEVSEEAKYVVEILKKYPQINIIASSHTDSRATKSYNIQLSRKRAKAIEKFLIENGIDKSRIESQWFGESKLVNNCSDSSNCSEKEHQLNRRTEFQIVRNK